MLYNYFVFFSQVLTRRYKDFKANLELSTASTGNATEKSRRRGKNGGGGGGGASSTISSMVAKVRSVKEGKNKSGGITSLFSRSHNQAPVASKPPKETTANSSGGKNKKKKQVVEETTGGGGGGGGILGNALKKQTTVSKNAEIAASLVSL